MPDTTQPSSVPSSATPRRGMERFFGFPYDAVPLIIGVASGYHLWTVSDTNKAQRAQFTQENPAPQMPAELQQRFADLKKTVLLDLSKQPVREEKNVSAKDWERIIGAYGYSFEQLKPGTTPIEEQVRAEIALINTSDLEVAKTNGLGKADIERMVIRYNEALAALAAEKSGKHREIDAALKQWEIKLLEQNEAPSTLILSIIGVALAGTYFAASLFVSRTSADKSGPSRGN